MKYTTEKESFVDNDSIAFMASLAAHVAIIVFLSFIFTAGQIKEGKILVMEAPVSEEIVEDSPSDLIVSEVPAPPVFGEVEEGVGDDVSVSDDTPVSLAIEPEFASEESDSSDIVEDLSDVTSDVSTGQNVRVVGSAGAEGAIDIIAAEIDSYLERRPTVVYWVFDQSVSLSAQRKKIAERLKNVFGQINNRGLRNMVVSFGEKVNFVVKSPTEDDDQVVSAIEEISVDETGKEMTFTAIKEAAEHSKQFRSSNQVMIIAFTDEVGNDGQLADKVSKYCMGARIPVYVVGVPAPFGMSEARMKYVEFDPAYQQGETWTVVNQGPESLFPEFVRIEGDQVVDSGFGPFNLSKICLDTGGIYFRIHANSSAKGVVSDEETAPMSSSIRMFFNADVMRNYRPLYTSAEKQAKDISFNLAKKSLVMAAGESVAKPLESYETVFPIKSDGSFATVFSEAQKSAAKIHPRIDAVYGVLLNGLADRPKIKEKRWQAGYDLSLGRILAIKARADAYNIMLAQAKNGMKFKNKNSDTWILVPSEKLSVGSQTQKIAKQAKELLEKVVYEHPGTPWAYYAEEELKKPIGYEWKEAHTGVNKPQMEGGGNPGDTEDPQKKMLAPPKKRNLKNI